MSLVALKSPQGGSATDWTTSWDTPIIIGGAEGYTKVSALEVAVDIVGTVRIDTISDVVWQFRGDASKTRIVATCRFPAGDYEPGDWPDLLRRTLGDCSKVAPQTGNPLTTIVEWMVATGPNSLSYQAELLDAAGATAQFTGTNATDSGGGIVAKTSATGAWDSMVISKTRLARCSDAYIRYTVTATTTDVWSWGMFDGADGDEPTLNDPDELLFGVKISGGNYYRVASGVATDTTKTPASGDVIIVRRTMSTAFVPQLVLTIDSSAGANKYTETIDLAAHTDKALVVMRMFTASMTSGVSRIVETAVTYTDADGTLGEHPQQHFRLKRGLANLGAVPAAGILIIRPGRIRAEMGMESDEQQLPSGQSWTYDAVPFTRSIDPTSLSIQIPELGLTSVNGLTRKTESAIMYTCDSSVNDETSHVGDYTSWPQWMDIPFLESRPLQSLTVRIRYLDGTTPDLDSESALTLMFSK